MSREATTSPWGDTSWSYRFGPLHGAFADRVNPPWSYTLREFATPLWLVVLVLGGWPAISITLAVRRAITRRRALRVGCCTNCGYDLRLTPTPPADGGDTLAVCPECGTAATGRG